MEAQVLTGELDGTVRDTSGALVPEAVVTIRNADQGLVVRTVKTDRQGQFTAPLLATGNYTVKVAAPGFEQVDVTGLQVHVGQPTAVPVTLPVGKAVETVTVSTAQTGIQLDTAAAGTIISSTETTELPLANRNYLQLMALQPGVSGPIPGENPRGNIRSSGAVNVQTYSVNGNPTSANGYYLDGADTLKRAGQQPVSFPSVDFIGEINLQRGSYGAEIGGPGAAAVNVQTKSGATAFHGGAFGFFRSQIFNANSPTLKLAKLPRPATRAADFGYFIGGPVWIPGLSRRATTKTFFFFGQEFLRQLDNNLSNITNIPTLAQRQGTFTTPVCTSYNAAATTCLTSTTTITNINAIAAQYLQDIVNYVPLPNNPADVQGLVYNSPGTNNETQTLIRIDHQFSSKLSAFFRYLDDPFHLTVPFGFQQVSMVPGVATAAMTNGSTSWLGHVTYVLGSNHVFEGGYSQRANWVTAVDTGRMAIANAPDVSIQLPYVNTLDHVPNLAINGSSYKGSGRYDERSPVQQIFLNNTNTWGRQTIKAGANVELQVSYSNTAGSNAGNFTFASTPVVTGSGTTAFSQAFANFLQGRSSQFTQGSIDPTAALQSNIYEGYVEDDVHLTPRFTILAGVRYTFYSPYSNAIYQGNLFNPAQNFYASSFNPAQAPTLDQNGNLCLTAPCGTSGRLPNPNYNATNGIIVGAKNSLFGNSAGQGRTTNIAPRFGFTLDVFGDGHTSLRGGFGTYFLSIIGNTAKNPTIQDPPTVVTATVQNPNFATPGTGSSASPQSLQAYDALAKQGYTQQFSLDLQQKILSSLSVDIGYYGSLGRHLTAGEDINQPGIAAFRSVTGAPATITAGNTAFLNLVRPYQGWSFINEQLNIFTSNYNSLQSSVRWSGRHGASVLANYTFSRALSDANTPQYNGNLRAGYGPTAYDRNDIFNAAIVYPLPFLLNDHHWYDYAVAGWQLSGIVTLGSGQFFTVTQSGVDPAGLGLLVGPSTARPDEVSNPNDGTFHNRYAAQGKWFNPASFSGVPAGNYRVGNAPIGSVRGPGYEVYNLSFYKNVTLEGKYRLQVRAESFNTFNHPNPTSVDTVLGDTAFGQVNGYGDPRRMQFG
ncbi:MAG TPA: carboxypeptidase-like regulatory domain-containing protein, partial [Acidobacteriaceae bacterium]